MRADLHFLRLGEMVLGLLHPARQIQRCTEQKTLFSSEVGGKDGAGDALQCGVRRTAVTQPKEAAGSQ